METTSQSTAVSTKDKGDAGEERAIRFLIDKGYSLICGKYRYKNGEIDCVMKDADGTVVFVEVKSSFSGAFGNPFAWITPAKQRTIARTALYYLTEHKLVGKPCRIDCIAVFINRIEHIRNAFLVR